MPEAKITTRLDSSGFNGGMRQIDKSVDKFDNKLAGLKSKLAAVFSIVALTRMTQAAVSAASAIEDLEVQFNVLFRSTDRAVKRVEDLKAFSAATPFQLEDIANASQTLEVFSEGILGGVDDLTLFGDAAASVGQKDMADLSYWVGRFYASLQSGRPILDSVNSLSRLKIMGPTITKQLLDMSASGADVNVIWNTFTDSLNRFEGGMLKASKTTSGTLSTMRDNWKLTFAAMGDVFEPLTKKAIGASTKIANKFQRLFELIKIARDPFAGAESKMGQETDEDERARKNAKIKEFADRRAAEKRAADDKKGAAERRKQLEDQQQKNKADTEKMIADEAAAKEKERQNAFTAAKQIGEIKTQKIDSVSRDRLAQIGGSLGGAISPQLQIARRALQVQENIAKILQDLPPRMAQQLINLGAYE